MSGQGHVPKQRGRGGQNEDYRGGEQALRSEPPLRRAGAFGPRLLGCCGIALRHSFLRNPRKLASLMREHSNGRARPLQRPERDRRLTGQRRAVAVQIDPSAWRSARRGCGCRSGCRCHRRSRRWSAPQRPRPPGRSSRRRRHRSAGAQEVPLGTWLKGMPLSTRTSCGRPSTRSARMFSMISSVPPAMRTPGAPMKAS